MRKVTAMLLALLLLCSVPAMTVRANAAEPDADLTVDYQVNGAVLTISVNTGSSALTDGRFVLSYDPKVLTYQEDGKSPASHCDTNFDNAGRLTVAFVNETALKAGALYTCTFAIADNSLRTELQMRVDYLYKGSDSQGKPVEATAAPAAFARIIPLTTGDWNMPFVDVAKSAWFYNYVGFAYQQELVEGVAETVFRPNSDMTRSQMVTVLYRMAGSPKVTGTTPFQDLPEGTYFYADALVWAYEAGIVKGVTQTKFSPNSPMTREQMVTFLARFAVTCGYSAAPEGSLSGYQDANQVSNYAVAPLTWAVERGLIVGTSNTTLSPRHHATRAQVATILVRFCSETVFLLAE